MSEHASWIDEYSGASILTNPVIVRQLYEDEGLYMREIADVLGCDTKEVRQAMIGHGIERRSNTAHFEVESAIPNDEIRRLYEEERMSTVKIASIAEVGPDTVKYRLNKMGVSTSGRNYPWTNEKFYEDGWLEEQYLEKKRTSVDIADELGVVSSTVLHWLKKKGIETRPSASDSRGGRNQYNHIRRMLSDRTWDEISEEVRAAADGCQLCGFDPDRALSVHHVVPVFAGGTNADDLLMPLCSSCHPTVEWYTNQFIDRVISDIIMEEANPLCAP